MTTNTPAKRRVVRNEDADVEAPSVSEQLADDITARLQDYPEGCPELRSVLQLPRRERAAYYRAADAVNDQLRKRNAAEKTVAAAEGKVEDGVEVKVDLGEAADYMDLLAGVEDLLAVVAVDPAAWRQWTLNADDATLIAVFNLYQRRSQPGEAERSSS